MVSIIVPVYNVENYLSQCIDSILVQSYKDFEVILIDDGSSDNSGIICDKYVQVDTRIRVLHQKNAGVSAARNNGMSMARGKWISFIDPDDFVMPGYLESFKLDKSDADIIVEGVEYYNHKTGRYFGKVQVRTSLSCNQNFKEFVEKNKLLNIGFPVGKVYARELIEKYKLRFDTSISFHEDHIFVLECFAVANNIKLIDATDYKYRCYHSTNTLSLKRHSWQNLNKAALSMLTCLDNMRSRFLVEGSSYTLEIYHFAYTPKISGVFELFRTNLPYQELQESFFSIIKRNELRKYYQPKSYKEKVMKIIMLYMPFHMIKLLFELYNKFLDRR